MWLLLLVLAGALGGDDPQAPPVVLGADEAVAAEAVDAAAVGSDAAESEGEGGALPGEDAAAAVGRPAPRQVPERWTIPPEVAAAVRAVAGAPIGVRMEAASRPFLGLPYVNDAAGEGTMEDPDPPSRYDAFDCLTFVEEVLALALAADPLDAPAIRDALRYSGAPAWRTRRHFMEAEWVPDAIANGLLEDVTASIGAASVLEKTVTPATWRGWGRRTRLFGRLADDDLPVGTWTLPYLDLDEAERVVAAIPPGSLVLTLRQPRDGVPIVVTHISTVVPLPEGGMKMRHATRMGVRNVRDDDLGWYVHHLRDYTNWPSLGITVLRPREQGPRRSALAPS